MKVLDKLGITPGPWKKHVLMVVAERVDETRLPGESWLDMRERTEPRRDAAEEKQVNDLRVANTAPEMLEALIENVIIYEEFFNDGDQVEHIQKQINIIEKATGRTWAEIKELIE